MWVNRPGTCLLNTDFLCLTPLPSPHPTPAYVYQLCGRVGVITWWLVRWLVKKEVLNDYNFPKVTKRERNSAKKFPRRWKLWGKQTNKTFYCFPRQLYLCMVLFVFVETNQIELWWYIIWFVFVTWTIHVSYDLVVILTLGTLKRDRNLIFYHFCVSS